MRTRLSGTLFLIAFVLIGGTSAAESTPVRPTSVDAASVNTSTQKEELERLRHYARQQAQELQRYKSAEYQIELKYYDKYHQYLTQKAELNLDQFKWQRRASEFLMWLVVAVVLAGVVFSGVQLWRASKLGDITAGSSLEITTQNIKLTSSVVGVVVLAISIVFFYFFLIEVYRVKLVDMSSSESLPGIRNIHQDEGRKTTRKDGD